MKLNSIKIVIADIKSKFENINIDDLEQDFFIKVADYGKYLFENEQTRTVLLPLQEQAKKDLRSYDDAFFEFIKHWKEYAKDLLNKAKNAGFEDDYSDPFKSTMIRIERILTGQRAIKSTDALGDYWSQYLFLANRFSKENKSNLIIPKHLDKHNNFYNLQAYYNHATSEWDRFKHNREIQIWWAYNQIERLTIVAYDLDTATRIIKGTSEADEYYAFDFRQILKGRKPFVANRRKFMNWLTAVHKYIIPRLELITETAVPIIGNYQLDYYSEDGRACYRGAEYTFKGKSRALLDLLFNNKNVPFDVIRIVEKCNSNVETKHKFRADKDIRDTLTYMRNHLKVRKGEYFPITKRGASFIWAEKSQ